MQLKIISLENALRNQSTSDTVIAFNKTVKNILYNYYILHETLIFDERDPPWSNKNIKQLITRKQKVYKCYTGNRKDTQIFNTVENLRNELIFSTKENQQKHY